MEEVKPEERPGATQGRDKTLWVVIKFGEHFTFTEVEESLKKWARKHKDADLRVTRIQEGRS